MPFRSTEGNTKIPTPQTPAGVWTAIASDFAVLSVSLCLHYLVRQTSSVTALLSVCPTQLLACSLAWFCTKATAHHWNSTYHRLLPAHRVMKLRDDIYVCVWHTHERKGACMYCYRTNRSLIKTQDQVPHILEGLDHTMWPQDQRVDLAPALFKSTGAASKTVLQFRSIYHSRATCALLELVKFIIHIHFTDGICWLLWNRYRIQCYQQILCMGAVLFRKTR